MASVGQGSLSFSQMNNPGGGGPPFPVGSADNGLSVDTITGTIVFGNDFGLGPAGPAKLRSNRELDMNGHTINWLQRNPFADDYALRFYSNYIGYESPLTSPTRGMAFSVDFPGNTGIYVSNLSTEPSWIPPFLLLQDSSAANLSARLQYNVNTGSMEITDDGRVNALAFFQPSGNVAIQAESGVDPGSRLVVDASNGTDPLANFIGIGGISYFTVDNLAGFFGLGDFGAAQTYMTISSASQLIDLVVGSVAALQVDAIAGLYAFGDTANFVNGTKIQVNDAGKFINFENTSNNVAIKINGDIGFNGTVSPVTSITVNNGIVTAVS